MLTAAANVLKRRLSIGGDDARDEAVEAALDEYPGMIPIMVLCGEGAAASSRFSFHRRKSVGDEDASTSPQPTRLSNRKFLVPAAMTVSQLALVIGHRLQLPAGKVIKLSPARKASVHLSDGTALSDVYMRYADNDGFVYITYRTNPEVRRRMSVDTSSASISERIRNMSLSSAKEALHSPLPSPPHPKEQKKSAPVVAGRSTTSVGAPSTDDTRPRRKSLEEARRDEARQVAEDLRNSACLKPTETPSEPVSPLSLTPPEDSPLSDLIVSDTMPGQSPPRSFQVESASAPSLVPSRDAAVAHVVPAEGTRSCTPAGLQRDLMRRRVNERLFDLLAEDEPQYIPPFESIIAALERDQIHATRSDGAIERPSTKLSGIAEGSLPKSLSVPSLTAFSEAENASIMRRRMSLHNSLPVRVG